ncbi:6064_t:CDS:1, partial [Paraglomus occultum]
TTQIQFPPQDRIRTPTPPLTDIPLGPPIYTPPPQFLSTPPTNTSNQRYFNLNINPRTAITNFIHHFTPTTTLSNRNLLIPGNYPQANLDLNNTPSSHYTPLDSPPPYQLN